MTLEPLLEDQTKQKLTSIIKNPPHALLLTGPAGMGKATVAAWLVEQLQVGTQLLTIAAEQGKPSIGIEDVRQLEHFLSLKVTGARGSVNRIALINDAHTLTHEAQNAMLKDLEEPPEGTMLLMTSSQQESLLPTIRSRVQTVEIQKPNSDELLKALPGDDVQKAQIMALSGGLPGLAFALANDDHTHPLVDAVEAARQLLQNGTFEKLATVDQLYKNKQTTGDVIYILMQMAHAALLTGRSSDRWQKVLKAAYGAESDIKSGVQPKLALTKLMLSL